MSASANHWSYTRNYIPFLVAEIRFSSGFLSSLFLSVRCSMRTREKRIEKVQYYSDWRSGSSSSSCNNNIYHRKKGWNMQWLNAIYIKSSIKFSWELLIYWKFHAKVNTPHWLLFICLLYWLFNGKNMNTNIHFFFPLYITLFRNTRERDGKV